MSFLLFSFYYPTLLTKINTGFLEHLMHRWCTTEIKGSERIRRIAFYFGK